MKEIPQLTYAEFAAKYAETQQCDPDDLRQRLNRQRMDYSPHGFMMLEAQLMDSSYYGQRVILPYGPHNTFKTVPDHPISPRGLASDTSVVIAILPIENWSKV